MWSNTWIAHVPTTRDANHDHACTYFTITAIYLENSTAFYAYIKDEDVVCWES